jgi:hypothetical protein
MFRPGAADARLPSCIVGAVSEIARPAPSPLLPPRERSSPIFPGLDLAFRCLAAVFRAVSRCTSDGGHGGGLTLMAPTAVVVWYRPTRQGTVAIVFRFQDRPRQHSGCELRHPVWYFAQLSLDVLISTLRQEMVHIGF